MVNCKRIKVGQVWYNMEILYQLENDYIFPKSGIHISRWLCKCLSCNQQVERSANNIVKGGCKYCRNKKEKSCNWKGVGDLYHEMFNNIRRHAIERSLEFSITIQEAWDLFAKQNKRCALSGIELVMTNKYEYNTASLDRIDSTRGYTIDNIQWTHKILNNMKSNMPNQEFINWCKLIADTHG